jgi:hypothetical protein
MRRGPKLYLPYKAWPEDDRTRWEAAYKAGADPFDDRGPAAHLAEPTRLGLRYAYGKFLAFLSAHDASLLSRPPPHGSIVRSSKPMSGGNRPPAEA